MTRRLYYTDASLLSFDARVRSCEPAGDAYRVVLDQTAFYPTSGGQPFDTGHLADAVVRDVVDEGDEVVHVTTQAVAVGTDVRGEIDPQRRLDHMQQHSGQHILSAAFERRLGVATVSFHLGAEFSTIDLGREVTATEIDAAEAEANLVVWENRAVSTRFATVEEAATLPLRKPPPARDGRLRLVEVAGFDLSACGGTHVSRTGAVGVIVTTGWERVKGGTRLSFACGERARRAFSALREASGTAARLLSVASADLATGVERVVTQSRELEKAVRRLREELGEYRAAELVRRAETIGSYSVVIGTAREADIAGLKALGAAVVRRGTLVVALVGDGTPAPTVLVRSAVLDLDLSLLMRVLVDKFGGRGGGRPELAQGGLPAAPMDIIDAIRRHLVDR
jgi:alanyl-tRNA synthetase